MANLYQVDSLEHLCQLSLASKLDTSNVLWFLELANERHFLVQAQCVELTLQDLQAACLEYILTNYEDIQPGLEALQPELQQAIEDYKPV